MSEATFAVGNFSGGEISKFAQGRFDLPAYRTSLKTCLNSFPDELGVWARRPGTEYLATTRSGLPGRVYSFDFKQQVPYAVEFTNGHMRFFAGNRLVDVTDSNIQQVVSISTANPAVVTTALTLLLINGDQVVFHNAGVFAPLLLNRAFTVGNVVGTTFTIFDALTGAPIDGSTLGPVPTLALNASRIYDLVTSYVGGTSNDWANVQIVQAETQGVLLNGNVPQLLKVITPPTATSFATFTLSALDALLLDGPYLDAGTTLTSASILDIQADGSYLITAGVFPDPRTNGLVAADVGRLVRLFNEPKQWPGVGTGAVGDLVTLYQGSFLSATYWRQLTAAAATTPGTNLTDWALIAPAQAAVWTWGRIATIVSPTQFTLTIAGTALLYSGTGVRFHSWQLGLYGNAFGWPTCGVYHEGRLWLSGVIDNRIDSSMSNNLLTFSPSNFDGTVASNNSISAIFNASDVNAIFWMNSDDRGIICGTQGGEWLVSAPTTGPMSPTNIKVSRATKIGCANIEPRRAGNTLVFVQRHQRKIMEYFPDVYSGRLTSPNLTVNAKHLTGTGIQEVAGYQQELAPMLWSRMGDGSLKGVTYKRENLNSSQGPNFCGWHRHVLGSGRTVTSVCMGSSDGNLDNLMMVTTDGSVRHVEMMTNIFEETSSLDDAWFLDDAVAPVISLRTAAGVTLVGLWHLNGKTVQIFAGGLDLGDRGDVNTVTNPFTDFVVSNGSVFVPFGDSISAGPGRGLFTSDFASTNPPIVVGFTYNSDGQMVKPIAPADSGARNGPALGKLTRAHRYAMTLVNTLGLSVGGTFAKLRPVSYETKPTALTMFTGIAQDGANDDDGYDNGWCWRISRPFPANVIAVALNLNTKDQ